MIRIGAFLVVGSLVLLAPPVEASVQDPRYEVEELQDSLVVRADGKTILQYQHEKGKPGSGLEDQACFFHALTTPKGVIVLDPSPKEFHRLRGGVLAWDGVKNAKTADFISSEAGKNPDRIVNDGVGKGWFGNLPFIQARNDWESGDKVLLHEECRAYLEKRAQAVVITVEYVLTSDEAVSLSKRPWGGFFLRFSRAAKAVAWSPQGEIERPAAKRDQQDSVWPAASWYGYRLSFPDGKVAGVAVINHPRNPESKWFNSSDECLINPCIVAEGDRSLKPGERLTLRYRVVAEDGGLSPSLLNELAGDKGWAE